MFKQCPWMTANFEAAKCGVCGNTDRYVMFLHQLNYLEETQDSVWDCPGVANLFSLFHTLSNQNLMYYSGIKFKAVPDIRVPVYPTKTVITRFHFSFQLPINDIFKFRLDISATQMEVSLFLVTKCCVGNGNATSHFLI